MDKLLDNLDIKKELWGLYRGLLLQFVKFICIYYLSITTTSNTVCSTS